MCGDRGGSSFLSGAQAGGGLFVPRPRGHIFRGRGLTLKWAIGQVDSCQTCDCQPSQSRPENNTLPSATIFPTPQQQTPKAATQTHRARNIAKSGMFIFWGDETRFSSEEGNSFRNV
eukprot:777384-Heterocapsa_arctica.AAC.1